jgi:hypothetical protein
MCLVTPMLTSAQLSEGKETLEDGREFFQSLPAIISDAKRASEANPNDPKSNYYGYKSSKPKGYAENLELAEEIAAVFKKHKKSDEHGSHFILAWRMYPNKDHPRWHQEEHACGCSAGGFCETPRALGGRERDPKIERSVDAPEASTQPQASVDAAEAATQPQVKDYV